MNIEELKKRAIDLEQELRMLADKSPEVAALAAYEPLTNAIQRAKKSEILELEEVSGMYYWKFETEIFWNFPQLGHKYARFSLMLQGLEE